MAAVREPGREKAALYRSNSCTRGAAPERRPLDCGGAQPPARGSAGGQTGMPQEEWRWRSMKMVVGEHASSKRPPAAGGGQRGRRQAAHLLCDGTRREGAVRRLRHPPPDLTEVCGHGGSGR